MYGSDSVKSVCLHVSHSLTYLPHTHRPMMRPQNTACVKPSPNSKNGSSAIPVGSTSPIQALSPTAPVRGVETASSTGQS